MSNAEDATEQRFAAVLRWARDARPDTLLVLCAEAPPDAAGTPVALRLDGLRPR